MEEDGARAAPPLDASTRAKCGWRRTAGGSVARVRAQDECPRRVLAGLVVSGQAVAARCGLVRLGVATSLERAPFGRSSDGVLRDRWSLVEIGRAVHRDAGLEDGRIGGRRRAEE